ncbi:unnamed protein product, partial [marine sediment metagenome]
MGLNELPWLGSVSIMSAGTDSDDGAHVHHGNLVSLSHQEHAIEASRAYFVTIYVDQLLAADYDILVEPPALT